MSLHNYLKGDASTSKAPGGDKSWTGQNPGPYLGVVKGNIDPTRMGRLKVHIPSLAKTSDPSENQLITCEYLAPFYGAKGGKYAKGAGTEFEDSQHSYGMWMVPPDLETKVLVIFAEGKMEQAFWMGCVQEPYTNHMMPGIASSTNTNDALDGTFADSPGGEGGFQKDKKSTYGSTNVPSGELNRNRQGALQNGNYESIPKPIHPFAETLLKQGLSADDIRGNTSSSARRETPSQVFGISTPGRKDISTTKENVGTKDSGAKDYVTRKTGHTFVMDDGAEDGTNQLTRLRTASGHQLLMHDTEGVVYIANGSGNAYIEMQKNGRIDVYSGVGGINLRTEGDFNLHSDSNINMHANGQIRMSSAKEMIQSADAILTVGEKGILQSSPAGGIQNYALSSISSFTPGQQLHGASGQFHLQGSQVHFNLPMGRPGSGGGGIDKWGPAWLTKDKVGMQLRDEGDVELAGKAQRPLKAFTRKTKTTVHRFVTHEPMFRANVISSDSIIPVDADDKKQHSRLANTPGTPEYVNMRNRLAENSAIRDAQYQADALQWVKQKMGDSTNAAKAKELLTDFGTKYNEIYGITEKINLPFDIKDSISEKFKGLDFNSPLKDLTSNLTSQVVENFTGKSKELFKDNVFVNSAGELFTLGSDTISGISGNIDLLNSSLNSVQGLTKNLSSGNIDGTIANLNSITQTYTSVVGGQIVGMNQIKSLASKAGLFNARDAARGGQTFLQNVGGNLSNKIGAIGGSVKSFFSGFKFSDARLKKDIKLISRSPRGINIYEFKYIHMSGTYQGVMAQEVPWARAMTDTGFYAVDYNKVDVEFRRLN
jgi:hypothetical protein